MLNRYPISVRPLLRRSLIDIQYLAGGEWTKKLLPKMHNRFIVNSFCLVSFYRLVWVKWLTAQMWAHYINKNHPLSDASIVDAVMLHHDGSTNDEIKVIYL